MKKVALCLMLVLCLLLFSCGKSDYIISAEEKEPVSTDATGDTLYIVNIVSRSYHLPSCYILKNTKEENKEETYDIEFLTERGYTPCKVCMPDGIITI